MTLDEQIEILENDAEFERKDGDLNSCLNFRQLAEWLKDYKRLKEQESCKTLSRIEYGSDGNLYELSISGGTNKALEQQPCEDAISRQATLDAIIKRLGIKDETYLLEAERTIYQQILAMPPVTPQPKIGHWIKTEEKDDAEPCILWECSCCHKEFRSVVHKVSNYCPSCGAKMIEPQESEVKE